MQRSLEALIAAELRAEMARQDVTAAQVSRHTGVTPSSLSRGLRGLRPMGTRELVEICGALHVSASEIVRRAEAAA